MGLGTGSERGSKEAATLPAPNRTHIPLPLPLFASHTHTHTLTLCFSPAVPHFPIVQSLRRFTRPPPPDATALTRRCAFAASTLFVVNCFSAGHCPRGGKWPTFLSSPPSRVVLFHMRLDDFNLISRLVAHHTCVMFLGLGITGGGTFLEASPSPIAAAE